MSERWQDLPGYEGLYQCSTLGNIRSVDRQVPYRGGPKTRIAKGQALTPYVNHRGYACVTLFRGKRHVKELHTLIAATFLGPRPDRHHTHHLNGDKLNNRPANLEYISRGAHSVHHNQGERGGSAKLTEGQVKEIRQLLAEGHRQIDIAAKYNVSQVRISSIKLRKSWRHI